MKILDLQLAPDLSFAILLRETDSSIFSFVRVVTKGFLLRQIFQEISVLSTGCYLSFARLLGRLSVARNFSARLPVLPNVRILMRIIFNAITDVNPASDTKP